MKPLPSSIWRRSPARHSGGARLKLNAGLFTNDDILARRLTTAGLVTSETVWRTPLGRHDKLIDGTWADMKNTGRDAGSVTAAQFLKRFVGDVPGRIDVAGTAMGSPSTIQQGLGLGLGRAPARPPSPTTTRSEGRGGNPLLRRRHDRALFYHLQTRTLRQALPSLLEVPERLEKTVVPNRLGRAPPSTGISGPIPTSFTPHGIRPV